MFEALHRQTVRSEVAINAIVGGAGDPVLLLHGYPQNLSMWAPVAPLLARQYTVVCTDLRGYRDSEKPSQDEDLANDSFRRRRDRGDPGWVPRPKPTPALRCVESVPERQRNNASALRTPASRTSAESSESETARESCRVPTSIVYNATALPRADAGSRGERRTAISSRMRRAPPV